MKTPREIYQEVARSTDRLGDWLRQPQVRAAIILAEQPDPVTVAHVITTGYAPDLNDIEVEDLGRDPFLVAAALSGPDRVVVTREISRPSKRRQNRKIPDVCADYGIICINDFELWRRLDFRL